MILEWNGIVRSGVGEYVWISITYAMPFWRKRAEV
jgi:hypothetical protein